MPLKLSRLDAEMVFGIIKAIELVHATGIVSVAKVTVKKRARFVKISGVGKREAAWEARQQRRSQEGEASRDHRSSWAKRRTLLRAMNSSSALICFEYFLSVET